MTTRDVRAVLFDVAGPIYDDLRARQPGSLRRRLATELLGDAADRDLLHARTAPDRVHPPGTMYDDVLPCLAALRGRVRVVVLANQEAALVDALQRDGVTDFVDVWGVSALVGREKPDPEVFAWALGQAGGEPNEAVHVGDRLDTDVRPAKALGLGTVWVLRGEAPSDPTPEQLAEPNVAVRDLTTLPDAVFRLAGESA